MHPLPRQRAFCSAPIRRRPYMVVLRSRADVTATASKHAASTAKREVGVKLTATSFSSRKLQATVNIHAPVQVVWNALTDYENLGKFIPSLVENKCLERRDQGCLLYQVGAQDVALGIKFSAACTLEIKEYPSGIPESLCTTKGDLSRFFPSPPSTSGSSTSGSSGSGLNSVSLSSADSIFSSMDCEAASTSGVRDISFTLVSGDFQSFKGIWRMQQGTEDPLDTVLHYSLFVRPHPWLPVKLIEDRISTEVVNNLKAVRQHTERVHKHQQKQQQQQRDSMSSTVTASVGSSSTWATAESSVSQTSQDDA